MDCALQVSLGQKRACLADGECGQEPCRDYPGILLTELACHLAAH